MFLTSSILFHVLPCIPSVVNFITFRHVWLRDYSKHMGRHGQAMRGYVEIPSGNRSRSCHDLSLNGNYHSPRSSGVFCIRMSTSINVSLQGAHFARDTVNRPGFSKFFFEAASEEREHAIKIIEYLLMRGELKSDIGELLSFSSVRI